MGAISRDAKRLTGGSRFRLVYAMARGRIELQANPEGESWEAVRHEPRMARGGIEPPTPRFSGSPRNPMSWQNRLNMGSLPEWRVSPTGRIRDVTGAAASHWR